ncbi:DUF969 family protein [Bifidobacterium longum]|nr:DUF969 family protein [Bifidobacterium longum subsp. longum]QHQ54917.1 DUF969 family protein [Bifidobacterium longum]MBZ4711355.1 DUF969 family protein [Bifidobacterium longum subsp. longum]RGK17571.1 DUF969 family protein [Bifidobacterium longum]RGV45721.1 DUF969 family protein [Bifidobacterium longum]
MPVTNTVSYQSPTVHHSEHHADRAQPTLMRPYAAAQLIGKVKNATPGMVIALYGVMRLVSAAFNVSFGGVAGFVRPVIMPMAVGAIEASGHKPNGTPTMEIATMAHGIEAAIEAAVSTETDATDIMGETH